MVLGQVVEVTEEEIAEVVGVSKRTVKRDWRDARRVTVSAV